MHGNSKVSKYAKNLTKESNKKAAKFNKMVTEVTRHCVGSAKTIDNIKKHKNSSI